MAQDYIMRVLQQVAAMLSVIIAKKLSGQLAEASQELEAACLRTVGLPLDRVKRLSPDELAGPLQMAGALRCLKVASWGAEDQSDSRHGGPGSSGWQRREIRDPAGV